MKKEIDAVGNVVNAAAKGKIQEKLKVSETKKKAAKAVTKGVNQGKKTGKKVDINILCKNTGVLNP